MNVVCVNADEVLYFRHDVGPSLRGPLHRRLLGLGAPSFRRCSTRPSRQSTRFVEATSSETPSQPTPRNLSSRCRCRSGFRSSVPAFRFRSATPLPVSVPLRLPQLRRTQEPARAHRGFLPGVPTGRRADPPHQDDQRQPCSKSQNDCATGSSATGHPGRRQLPHPGGARGADRQPRTATSRSTAPRIRVHDGGGYGGRCSHRLAPPTAAILLS